MQPEAEHEPDYWKQNDESLSAEPVATTQPKVSSGGAPISWQASEAVHHEKNALWFVGLIAISVILLAISIFVIKSWTFSALIVVMAVAVAVISSRPPRVMQYSLTHQGLQINEKTFSLHDFRAFGVLQDGALYSVILIPHKRFMPGVNVYFPAENGEEIVDVFGAVLPMEHVESDFIDRLSRKLHI